MIEVRELKKYFPVKIGVFKRPIYLKAVDGVSFSVDRAKTLALVGESGSGKTTVGRTVIRLYEPTSGEILFKGENISTMSREEFKSVRTKMQMIYQNPYSSLNPRLTVFKSVAEPLVEHSCAGVRSRVYELLDAVGLSVEHANKYPDELSGGQCQRVAIARALALQPEFLVLDEPTSALDVSVQAQVLNLLIDVQKEKEISYLFISHDLSVVRYLSDRVAIMYLGKIVEIGFTDDIFDDPLHPYTKMLLDSIPVPSPGRKRGRLHIPLGEVASPLNPPTGCKFHPRCPFREKQCVEEEPDLIEVGRGRLVRCHFVTQREV